MSGCNTMSEKVPAYACRLLSGRSLLVHKIVNILGNCDVAPPNKLRQAELKKSTLGSQDGAYVAWSSQSWRTWISDNRFCDNSETAGRESWVGFLRTSQ